MEIVVNGRRREVTDGSTVSELVSSLGFGDRHVVVERNGEPVERERFSEIAIEAGDRIEIVQAVAGG